MDTQFYGANCIVISTKHGRIVVDDNLVELGAKSVAKEGDIALFTGEHKSPVVASKLVIDRPGEYEVSNVSVFGIAARAHMDEEGKKTAVMYKLVAEDLNMLITGHVYPELSDTQLETIGMIDVLFIPVGGNGFTLDAVGALKLIKKIEPKLIIPTYYEDSALTMPMPAQSLEQALKELGMEPKETTPKLRLKGIELHDTAELIVLERP